MQDELPQTKAGRIDWVIRAPNNAEMRRRYDVWARAYDSDVGAVDDYLAPMETAKVAADVLDHSARILDAGAGTGLLGAALKARGFRDLTAVDYSAPMLEIARAKGIYAEIHTCDLSKPTALPAQSFDAVVTCGTTSQMPPASLQEFLRVLRPGGKIIFAVIPDAWVSCGWADILARMETAGHLRVVSRGPAFQMMPTTEPQFYCEIWVLQAT
jgi:predicted TPR repeat methyltransferase